MTKNTADKKYCPKCDRWFKRTEFYKNAGTSDGLTSYCKKCNVKVNKQYKQNNKEFNAKAQQSQKRMRNHKITGEKFNEILKLQNNKCAICENEFTHTPVIDHDHSCCLGRYSCGNCTRGLLCRNCNMGLGQFKDNIEFLRNAVKYLKRS